MTQREPSLRYAEQRAAMAAETRQRIIEACVTILARGVAELSIPAVAREAGVSVPTVYRNFPDKRTLVHETAMHLRKSRQANVEETDLAGMAAALKREYARSAALPEALRRAILSEPILEARRELGDNRRRLEAVEATLEEALGELTPTERRNAVWMTTVLCSSWTLRGFQDLTPATPEEAAEIAVWAIARMLGRESLEKPGARTTRRKR